MNAPPEGPRNGGSWLVPVLLGLGVIGLVAVLHAQGFQPASPPAPTTIVDETSATLSASSPAAATLFEWDQDTNGPGPTTYQIEGLTIVMSSRADDGSTSPVLQVRTDKGVSIEEVGSSRPGKGWAQLGVGRIDPASNLPQVLFTTFTGGAHCCADIRLLEIIDGRWRVVQVAIQDGGRLEAFPSDLDDDGLLEVKLNDDRFLYAFASYADSWTPPSIAAVRRGEVQDRSAEPSLESVFEAYLPEARKACLERSNGACAAFVAAAARVGQTEEAWRIMLDAYDPTDDWPLPSACRVKAPGGSCPDVQEAQLATYPEALRWFLGDAGYLPPVYVPPPEPSGPSFDCARAEAEVLQLICGLDELAAADREMAWLYWRALARSREPSALIGSQKAFLASRDEAPPDALTLLRIYQARLVALRAVLGER